MTFVLGIDGGATRTRAALVDSKGRVLARSEAGATNLGSIRPEQLRDQFDRSISAVCSAASVRRDQLEAVYLGIAGVVTPEDRDFVRGTLATPVLPTSTHIGIEHDIRIALAGALLGNEGIALIAGTGSSCFGRQTSGATWQAGGWEHLIDDVGGAFWLAIEALKAATRDFDGRGARTTLTKRVVERLQLPTIPHIIRRLHYEGSDGPGHPMTKTQIASLAPLVVEEATSGDAVAAEIIDHGARGLTAMVAAVVENLAFETKPIPVATVGSVIEDPLIQERFRHHLELQVSEATICQPALPPVLGAALLALELAGIPPSDCVIDNLKSSDGGAIRPLPDSSSDSSPGTKENSDVQP